MLGHLQSQLMENAQITDDKNLEETVKTQLCQVGYFLRKEHGEFGMATRIDQIAEKIFARTTCLDLSQVQPVTFKLEKQAWSSEQLRALAVFGCVAVLWIFKDLINDLTGLCYKDESAAVLGAVVVIIELIS